MPSYPFHTGEEDNEIIAGILFVAGNGGFYEFQNPENHDEYARWKNPRTGDVITYKNRLDESVKRCMGGHVKAKVLADEWLDFREIYCNASGSDTKRWKAMWDDIHTLDQSEQVTA